MAAWLQDLRYTLRRFSKSPGFVAAALLSISLGIAANSTIFSMVSRFVLRSAPVGDPGSLMSLHVTNRGECCNAFSWPLFADLRDQAKSFSGVASYYELVPASIGGNGEPERVWGQSTTSNFFDVLQLPMTLGRGFTSDEEHLPVIVLGHRLWQRRFAPIRPSLVRPSSSPVGPSLWLASSRPFSVELTSSSTANSGSHSAIWISCCLTRATSTQGTTTGYKWPGA
jgi:hypothetical protein